MKISENDLQDIVESVKLSDMIENENSLDGDDVEGDESDSDMEDMDLSQLVETYFTESKKGRNIADVLCEIKRNFEVHNKLLQKVVNILEKKS